ncbi:MAG: serine hydrolase domain-containing protein [Eubacteriales bacterium]
MSEGIKVQDYSCLGFHQERLEGIRERTEGRLKNKTLVAASTLVIKDDKTVWYSNQGMSDLENGTPLKPDAIWRLASMTKPVTAAAAMSAVERGLFSLEDKVSRYVPCFSSMRIAEYDDKGEIIASRPAKNEILLQDLLTHTSGIAQEENGIKQIQKKLFPSQGQRLSDIVPRLGELMLDFEPRERTGYNPTVSFDILAYIIEKVSGMEYEEYLKKYLFSPLGIKDLAFSLTEEQEGRRVKCYSINPEGIRYEEMHGMNYPGFPNSYTAAGAALQGSIDSYSRFVRMLAGYGELEGVRVLSRESVERLQSPVVRIDDSVSWALAMRHITADRCPSNPLPRGTYGWSGAFGTHFFIVPSLSLAAIYCTNLTTAGGAGAETAREFEYDVMAAFE